MATVTISRGLGSLGDEVAQIVGARLGFHVVSRELINQAARRAGAPEMALAVIDDLGLLAIKPTRRDQMAYRRAVKQVMMELVSAGSAVIVGRAGCVVLAGRADVLHVRVVAPETVRCERVAAAAGIDAEAALARVVASDRTRAAYLRRHYKVDWNDANLYDLIVNTAQLTPETAGAVICHAFDCRWRETILPHDDAGLTDASSTER